MKRALQFLLFFGLGSAATLGCYGLAQADEPVLIDAGPGSAVAAAPETGSATSNPTAERASDKLHDITEPVAAWDDAKAARKVGWPLAVFAALVMLTKSLGYANGKLANIPLLGRLAKWLSVGKRAMVVSAVGTFGAAGYDVTIGGGSVVAALVAGGVAAAGMLSPMLIPKEAPS